MFSIFDDSYKKSKQKQKKKRYIFLMRVQNQKFGNFGIIYSLKCGIASLLSTCLSVSILHPFQLIKVRFQSHDGQANQQNIVPKYRGIVGALRQIVADQGYFGLYKGLSVTVISAGISSSLFFTFYENRKKTLLSGNSLGNITEINYILLAAIQAGVAVICITQPMWVIKTRMLLNTKKDMKQRSNIYFTIKQVNEQYGLKGFYKGFSMNLLLSSNRALQMITYQGSRKLYDRFSIPQSQLMEKNFICGGMAKLGNVLIIYPLTTIRTRIIQNQYVKVDKDKQKYNNILEIISKTFKKQGIQGFYKGMTANLVRGIPERSIFFYSYQIIKNLLLPQSQH